MATTFEARAKEVLRTASFGSYPSPGRKRPSLNQYETLCKLVVDMAKELDRLSRHEVLT